MRQRSALIDEETWTAVRDQSLPTRRTNRRKADAAEPSLLAAVLVDARGERFTPSHAVKKGRRYRCYVSTAVITQAGTDRAQGWRLPAREIEDFDDPVCGGCRSDSADQGQIGVTVSPPGPPGQRSTTFCRTRWAGYEPVEFRETMTEMAWSLTVPPVTHDTNAALP